MSGTGDAVSLQQRGVVAEVHDARCLDARGAPHNANVAAMLDRALALLFGDAAAVWSRFFAPEDRVGIKLNCVGWAPTDDPQRTSVVTSAALIRAVVASLRSVGVRSIALVDRYGDELARAGYPALAAELGLRCLVGSTRWDPQQLALDGDAGGGERSPGVDVVGYDPDVFVTLDYGHPLHAADDPRRFRSHVSTVVTRHCDKIINLCLLKDHVSAGLTGALKNLSHGLVDNVCRSHASGPLNQTATFVPAVLTTPIIRQKAVLHVMEGFHAVYHGGPWASVHTFAPRTLFAATDPVALDRIALARLDEQRASMGLPPLAVAGQARTPDDPVEQHPLRGTAHVQLAGLAGLGLYARDEADWQAALGRKEFERRRATGTLPCIELRRASLG